MSRRFVFFLLSVCLGFGLLAGFSMHRYKLYPRQTIVTVLQRTGLISARPDYNSWSIGIWEGRSPFRLSDPVGLENPVLTAESVDDVDAEFVADPFMIPAAGKYYMFFEVLNQETGHGDIGYAESKDAFRWKYGKIVLDEDFHLSYPYVFEWKGEYYMIPESSDDLAVRLYKAASFPAEWKYAGSILSGYRYVDSSILRHENKWWLFLTTPESDHLNIYYSEDLLGEWKPHPMNPVVKKDKSHSRPGGRILCNEGHIYRFAQNDEGEYGRQVFAFEITELSEEAYSESPVSGDPVVEASGQGWNRGGMHHVDPLKIGDHWIVAVDGRSG